MSNLEEKKPYPPDTTPKEQKNLDEYIANGLPGIGSVDPNKISEAMNLYFNGASYHEISARTGIKKLVLMYLSYKCDWYDRKMESYQDLLKSLSDKAESAHLKSFHLITDFMSTLEDYYRNIVDNYRRSKDSRIIDTVDIEKMKLYMKFMEQIQKLKNPPINKDRQPMMGLNLPNGGTLKKIDDNTIEVSPQSPRVEAELTKALATLAQLKRERDNQKG